MLIITGTIAYDYIMNFPGAFSDHILPEQIHKINLSFIVDRFAKRRGGTAGNVSYNLGLLNTSNVLFSTAGKDFDDYKKSFKNLPVNLTHVEIDKTNYTSTGFAMTDKANNQIWGYFYGAGEKIKDLKLKSVALKNDLVLVGPSGAPGSMSMVNQCVELGLSYMLDPGFILTQVTDQELEFGIEHATYVVGNDYEIKLIQTRLKNWKSLFADKIIITTLGEKGCKISYKNDTYTINAVKPKKIVDPTGAGDAWRAGFLCGLAKKLDLKTCGQIASNAASFAVETYGTQEHKFTTKEFNQRYGQTFGSLIPL